MFDLSLSVHQCKTDNKARRTNLTQRLALSCQHPSSHDRTQPELRRFVLIRISHKSRRKHGGSRLLLHLIARLHIPVHCPGNGHSSMKSFDPQLRRHVHHSDYSFGYRILSIQNTWWESSHYNSCRCIKF